MGEQKTTSYLKYALGEIILVVIGILIALSINNWNEKRKNQLRADELYKKLKHELAQNINYLQSTYDGIEHQLEFLQLVLHADDSNTDTIISKTRFGLSPLFYMSSYSQFFDPPSDVYETALNEGSLILIKDKGLTRILQEFHQSYKMRINQLIEEEYKQGREINDYLSKAYKPFFESDFISSDHRWDEEVVKEVLLNIRKDGTLKYKLAERIDLKKARQYLVLRFINKFSSQLKKYQ